MRNTNASANNKEAAEQVAREIVAGALARAIAAPTSEVVTDEAPAVPEVVVAATAPEVVPVVPAAPEDEDAPLIPVGSNTNNSSLIPFLMKLPAPIAGILFGFALEPKKPEELALVASMDIATVIPVLNDPRVLSFLSNNKRQASEVVASAFMSTAVILMLMGTAKGPLKSDSEEIGFSAVILFNVFAHSGLIHNIVKLVSPESVKMAVPFVGSISGFVGSVLFLATQALNYIQAKEAGNKEIMQVAEELMAASSLFIAVTLYHTCMSGRAILSKGEVANNTTETTPLIINNSDEERPVKFGCAAFFRRFLPACCFDSNEQSIFQSGIVV